MSLSPQEQWRRAALTMRSMVHGAEAPELRAWLEQRALECEGKSAGASEAGAPPTEAEMVVARQTGVYPVPAPLAAPEKPSALLTGYEPDHPARQFRSAQAPADAGAASSTMSRASQVSSSPSRVSGETITHGRRSRVSVGPAALSSTDPQAVGTPVVRGGGSVMRPGRAGSGGAKYQAPTVMREGRRGGDMGERDVGAEPAAAPTGGTIQAPTVMRVVSASPVEETRADGGVVVSPP